MSEKTVVEVPAINCASGRHDWDQSPKSVWVKRKFLWWRWEAERIKVTCKLCGKVEYQVPFDGF
jgi:hypothetical protein